MALPATIQTELMQEINQLALARGALCEFTWRRLERDAHKLLKVDVVEGYIALGALASIKKDVDSVDHFFHLALKNSFEESYVSSQYAIALQQLDRMDRAYTVLKNTYPQAQDDISYLELTLKCAAFNGQFHFLKKVAERLERIGSSKDPVMRFREGSDILSAVGLADEDIFPIVKSAQKACMEFGLNYSAHAINSMFCHDDKEINFFVRLDCDVDNILSLEEKYMDIIEEQDILPSALSAFNIVFLSEA